MSEQDVRAKNFAFNYQSDIFNQKAPVKTEYNYSHKGFQQNSSNKTSFNFLSWEDNKQTPPSNQIKRNQSDMISYRYHLSIADAGSPVIFIKPGEEPTEHVLHELIELQAVGRKFKHKPVLVFAKPYNEGDMNLKKVLDFDDWDIETVEDYDGKVLRDILTDREDVLNYPYVFYVRSENEINFIGNGYSVGIIDNLYETQDAVE